MGPVLTPLHLCVWFTWRSDRAVILPPYWTGLFAMHRKWTSGIAVLGLAACSSQQPPAPSPASVAASVPAQQACIGEGTASWYHAGARRRAASGELVAAHRSLPLGTLVQVTALDTGRTVTVRISGRGPFRRSRVIDVSEPAAAQLGILHDGVARVQLATDGTPDQACPLGETRISAE
jgi:rare lipoprotein A